MRFVIAILICSAFANLALADPTPSEPSDLLCGGQSLIEEDMRITESEFTLERALGAVEFEPEFCGFSHKIEGECWLAFMNRQRLIEGYLKKQRVLEATESEYEVALADFCEFMKKAHYFD